MHAVQVSFHADPRRREPAALLEAWPTLPAVARAALHAGVTTTVVQAAAYDAELERDGVRYLFVREPVPTRLHGRLGLWATPGGTRTVLCARDVGGDVVHVQGLGFPRQLGRLARQLNGVPILVQDHADRAPPRWAAPLWRRALDAAAGVAFTAREQAEGFVSAGALPPRTPVFEVLESSTTFSPGNRGAARRDTGMHGDPCCVWLGRLDANKDPLTVLAAFELAAAFLPDARLWMYWLDAPLEAAVRRRVAASRTLRERVHLMGALPHPLVEQALRAADFLIQASHREGSGYAVIEALACGTTPILTDIPSFRRLTRGGRVGALFPPRDASLLAARLVSLSGQDGIARREAARAHFESYLCFGALGRELVAAYDAVVS